MDTRKVIFMHPRELYQFILNNPKGTKLPGDPIIICTDSLGLYATEISWLPDELFVIGNLHIEHCTNLQELPAKLFVGGDLYMSNTKIRVIPADLHVCGDIHAEGMALDFPDEFIAHRSLYLNDKTDSPNVSPLHLPKGYLDVNCVLNVKNRKNVEWPKRMTVDGSLLADELSGVTVSRY